MTLHYILITIGAILPAFFWMRYVYKKDRLKPEPKKLVFKIFLRGIFVGFPILALQDMLGIRAPYLLSLVVIAPLTEELLKFAVMRWSIYPQKKFDEIVDGIVYGAAIGLGFATIENVLYIRDMASKDTIAMTILFRALISVPAHAIFTSMYGYGLSIYKLTHKRHKHAILWGSLAISILLHAAFNYLTVLSKRGAAGMLVLLVGMWIVFHYRVTEALVFDRQRKLYLWKKLHGHAKNIRHHVRCHVQKVHHHVTKPFRKKK